MLKDQPMEFYVNPSFLNRRIATARMARIALPLLALCLALLSAAPSRAQQANPSVQRADALQAALDAHDATAGFVATDEQKSLLERMMDRQHLPTPLIGRIPAKVQRAASGAYDRRVEQATMSDVLNTLVAPRRRGPNASTVQTTPVTSTVQTSDITYPTYTFNTQGTLIGTTPSNLDPFFSPSERFIYFASNRVSASNPAPGAEYHIWAISPSGTPSSLVQITGLSTQPTTSAAGEAFKGERYPYVINDNQIVYTQLVANAQGVTHYDLYEASLGTSGITGTPTQITGLALLPDGVTTHQLYQTLSVAHPSFVNGEIAFAGTALNADETPIAGQPAHIYLYSFSGGTFIQLTTGPADDENPAISPDQPIVAFDTNVSAAGYAHTGTAATGEIVSAATKATRDIWLVQLSSGSIVNQFTTITGTASNNIEPFWSQTTTNHFLNTTGNDLYLFFSSDRNNGVYDIYFLRAQDTSPTPPVGQLVEDREGDDNGGNGTNTAAEINTSSPLHHTNDSLATPINNFEPTISTLHSVYSVVYISDRYLINNVSDNPLDPGNELTLVGKAGYPALPASAQDNEPTSLTTDPATAAQGSDEILASQIVDIGAPTLLPYDTVTGEVIHVEDQSAPGKATRSVGAGNTVQFIVRLSDRQTGLGRAFLQLKDPNSKYQQQSGTPLEHKVYTRYGGQYATYPNYTMHFKENDESTTLFNVFSNFSFGLNAAFYNPGPPGPVGDQEYGASIAGSNGGQPIATGGLLVYPRTYPEVNTVVNTVTPGSATILVNATTVIDDFATADTLLITSPSGTHPVYLTTLVGEANNLNGTYSFVLAAAPAAGQVAAGDTVIVEDTPVTANVTMSAGSATSQKFNSIVVNASAHFQIGDTLSVAGAALMVLNGMSGPDNNGNYTFAVSSPSGDVVIGYVPVAMGALGPPISVVARFDPQGQEVDCEAIDGINYATGGAPVPETVANFTVPYFTPGFEDADPLDGAAELGGSADVDSQTGPINRASGSSVWLALTPFQANAAVAVATLAGATTIPVDNTSGIVPGDTVQIGTEQAVVGSLTVAAQQGVIPNGTPEIVLETGAILAHAMGEAVTLVSSPSGGVLYEATWVSPTTPSDYFIDTIAFDNAAFPLTNGDGVTTPFYLIGSNYNFGELNWRIYDNVWGFSTQPFTPTSGPSVLVVSDYALPQKFFQGRFGTTTDNNLGVSNLPFTYFGAESYLTDIETDDTAATLESGPNDYLTGITSDSTGNYGGISHAVAPSWGLSVGTNVGSRGIIDSSEIFNGLATGPIGYPNGLGVNSYSDSDQTNIAIGDVASGALLPSSQRYDIWRILARGPIPSNILNAYGPTVTTQPDTTDSGYHPVQVANDMVIWLSPFTGNQFSTLGTILDPNTQTTIESFVNNGGRFFIEGQDIAYALSGGSTSGGANSGFLTNYLKAQFLSDTSGFATGAYLLAPATGAQSVISTEAYRNATNLRQHRGFTIINAGGFVNYLPPSLSKSSLGPTFQQPTVSHTPFSLNIFGNSVGNPNQEPVDDATTRTDGSMDDGWGDYTTNFNAPVQGNIDGVGPVTTGGGIVYQAADFVGMTTTAGNAASGIPPTGQSRLLYYFGDVPLTLTAASTGAIPVGSKTISLAVPSGSSASALLNEFAVGDTFLLDTGANAETITIGSSTINSAGVPVITLLAGTATTKAHLAGVTLTRSGSTDFTNFVGFSSFGLEALSQELFFNSTFTPMNSAVKRFTSANKRTNIIHNLICTTRTGTIFGQVTDNGSTQPGVLVEAMMTDVITGAVKTYTSISDSTGQYRMEGVLPGLYAFAQTSGGYENHAIITTNVHGGDTLRQDIDVTPAPTGSVVVNVKDKLTQQPLGGVTVTLTEIHGAFTYTGTTATTTNVNAGTVAGQVTFPAVAPSVYTITYVKAGYDVSNPPDATGPAQSPPNNVVVTQSPTVIVNTTLSSAPATVFGLATVVGGPNNGQALQGVSVTFTGPTGTTFTATSGPTFAGPDSTTTILPANYPLNDSPMLQLPATPAGVTYTFIATINGYVPFTGTVVLTSGQLARIDLPMILAGDIKLIVDNSANGQPITTVVTATATAPGGTSTTVTNNGQAVPVIPNTAPGYTVTLPSAEFTGTLTKTMPVAAGQTVTFIFSVTPTPGIVTGTISDQSTGAPIAGAVVTLTDGSGHTITSAPTGANGVYRIVNVPSGLSYTATASATNFSPMTVTNLNVAPAATVTQDFALKAIFGTVTGTITDIVTNGIIAGATVTLTSGGHTYTGTSAATGIYTITGVLASASPYTATVAASGYVTKTMTGLIVPADGTLSQNFALTSTTGSIMGTVKDASAGTVIVGATVTLVGGGHTYTATTNTAGAYTITGVLVLPAGVTYAATAVAFQYKPSTVQVTINPSAPTTQDFLLTSTIIHHYPGGLQMFSAPYDYTGQPLASILQGEVSKSTGQPVNLVAAWIPLAGAYALTPTSPCESLHLGQGYWARFGASGGLLMATGTADTAATTGIPLQAGWNMIGDPYLTSEPFTSLNVTDSAGNTQSFVTASGASVNFVNPQLYSYNQANNTYTLLEINNPYGGTATPSIDPYIGYWIYAYTPCTLVFTKQ